MTRDLDDGNPGILCVAIVHAVIPLPWPLAALVGTALSNVRTPIVGPPALLAATLSFAFLAFGALGVAGVAAATGLEASICEDSLVIWLETREK